jgi:DNA-binding transcriptional regulator LsrR (DeoR family)
VILDGLQQKFGLRGGLVADSQPNEADTNRAVADALIERLTEVEGMTVGIGWGPMISTVVRRADQMLPGRLNTRVYPLAGSRGILSQDYRMDEILTTFAKSTGGQAFCWDAPAFAEDPEDMERLKDTDAYRQMERGWKAAKIAFVDIENYPSVPDFATAARYGSRLAEEKAVGKILSYYYDIHGRFIKPEVYCSMQIPREILSKRKFVVGLCSAGVNSRALYGALKTGIFTHIAASKDILKEILDLSE